MLTQEVKINVELIKKILTEKKTTLLSFRNQDRKKVKVETEKVNKLLLNIPMGKITEVNILINSRAKLFRDKISVPLRNQNRNTKPGWEIRLLLKEIATTSESDKEGKTREDMLR